MSVQTDDDGFVTQVASSSSAAVDKLAADLGEGLRTEEEDDPHKDTIGLLRSQFEVEVTLADQQADPSSPLFSVKSFDELGLSPELAKGVRSMGFVKPSKIQERALPLMLNDPPTNLIAQSQAGTGKTAAFTLAMLSRVDVTQPVTQAVCLAPTRELARQIMGVVVEMGKFTSVTTGYAIKETPPSPNAHIVIGTAGTLLDLMSKGAIDPRHLKVFVLDEADNMLEKGTMSDQTLRVKNRVPKTVQMLLFSATFPTHVRNFANRFAPKANEIMLRTEELSVEGVKQFYLDCASEQQKFEVLVQLYSLLTVGQSIIFVQRRSTADSVAARMIAEGHKVTSLTGTHQSGDRDQTIDDFRDGKTKVLITTNVIARGIDILQVNLVVNYDLPLTVNGEPDVETYLHRIGRTGRFGRKGVSINFVHDKPTWTKMHFIENALGRPIERISTDDMDEMEKILRSALKEKGHVAGSGGPSQHQK
ncbi:putative DBP5-ATP-dependent RNA helicase of the DEAD-box family [Serendipita vermifera]|nr:putative DBP5-ATP-dependent RNA helicase of the DEAD-box family [Serendipita vermifera]